MPAFVKTDKDEELWSKAKARAKEQGRAKDWAYITGIYKSMKGGKVAEMKNAKWKNLSSDRRAKARQAFAPMMVEDEEIVMLPGDVKRLSAERMRELGRSLMVAGTRPPRAQLVSIAVTLDGLLEQMKMLGEQNPSLNALRRRVLLGLRGKVLGG